MDILDSKEIILKNINIIYDEYNRNREHNNSERLRLIEETNEVLECNKRLISEISEKDKLLVVNEKKMCDYEVMINQIQEEANQEKTEKERFDMLKKQDKEIHERDIEIQRLQKKVGNLEESSNFPKDWSLRAVSFYKKFDIAIHLVSLNNQDSEGDLDYVSSVNVLPTWNILRLLTKKGLKKFIYFSTIHVYGMLPKTLITEDFISAPKNVYGLTHLLSENICNYFNESTETDCINIRLSNGYGSPALSDIDCWWLVLNDFCKTAYQKEKIIFKIYSRPSINY